MSVYRVYEPHELASDGYPRAWRMAPCPNDTNGDGDCGQRRCPYCGPDAPNPRGIKDFVRIDAGHRCVRCKHPYVVGKSGRWESITSDPRDVPAEQLIAQMEDGRTDANQQETYRADQAILWSACDPECDHGGPTRGYLRSATSKTFVNHSDHGQPAGGWVQAGYYIEAAWRVLTVHHLNGRKHDCRWWNLAALCQRCHLHIQKKVQMERVYPFEHTEWFRPYAAAWYAYAYLGEDLTREQTMGRLDDLLALERMA